MNRVGRKILLACGAIGPPLFVAVFLREGSTRPGYNPRRHPVSSLAISERGWRQRTNFLMAGTAIVAFSRGIHSGRAEGRSGTVWEARLLGVAGSGLIGAGIFTTDPVFGYPPDVPLLLEQESPAGHLHNLASLLFFAGLPSACFVAGRRSWQAGNYPWTIYSLFSGLAMLVTFVLAGVGFTQHPRLVQRAGVVQRLSITTGLAWITVRAARLLRATRA